MRSRVTSSTAPTAFDDDDLVAVLLVPVEHRRRLLVVHAEPRANRLGIVVLAAHQRAAALVADVADLAAGVRRLAILAHRAAAQAGARSRRCRCRTRAPRRPSVRATSSIVSSPSACGTVRTAPSRITPFAYCGCASSSPRMPRITESGTRSPRSMNALASSPSFVPARTRRAQHVARRERRHAERLREQRRLRAFPGAGLSEEDDDHGC